MAKDREPLGVMLIVATVFLIAWLLAMMIKTYGKG